MLRVAAMAARFLDYRPALHGRFVYNLNQFFGRNIE